MATGDPQVLIQGCRMKELEYGHRSSIGSDPGVSDEGTRIWSHRDSSGSDPGV